MLQVTEREMERAKAEAEGASGAKLIEQKNNAESRRVAAEAEAYEKQQLGEAEAAAIKAKVYGSGRASNFYLFHGTRSSRDVSEVPWSLRSMGSPTRLACA